MWLIFIPILTRATQLTNSVDICTRGRCGEHGICSVVNTKGPGLSKWACKCEDGWIQDDEHPIPNCLVYSGDLCIDKMCSNGGGCDEIGLDVNCTCPAPYIGRYCTEEIEEFTEDELSDNSTSQMDKAAFGKWQLTLDDSSWGLGMFFLYIGTGLFVFTVVIVVVAKIAYASSFRNNNYLRDLHVKLSDEENRKWLPNDEVFSDTEIWSEAPVGANREETA